MSSEAVEAIQMEHELLQKARVDLLDAPNNELHKLSLLRIVLLTSALAGCQLCWAIQIGHSTSTFEEYGMPASFVSAAWLAGPLSGIIVQPLVGSWSDSVGRRKPFIGGALACILFSLLLFSNSDVIGKAFHDESKCFPNSHDDKSDVHASDCPAALTASVIGFWLLDFSVNGVQGPIRTLLTDVVHPSQLEQGNQWMALMSSLGNLVGYLLGVFGTENSSGGCSLKSVFPFFGTELRALYTIGGILVTIVVVLALCSTGEAPHVRRIAQVMQSSPSIKKSSIKRIYTAMWNLPAPVRDAFLVQCCTWLSFFTTFIFATSWVGKAVMQGDPQAPKDSDLIDRYNKGVMLGNWGMALQAVVSMLISFQAKCSRCKHSARHHSDESECLQSTNVNISSKIFFPGLLLMSLQRFGTKYVYCMSQIIQGVALLLMGIAAYTHSPALAIVLLGTLGFTWACTMTIPWAITGRVVSTSPDKGTYLSILNLSQSLPELVASGIGAIIMAAFDSETAVLMVGGGIALIGAVLVLFYRVGDATDSCEVYDSMDEDSVESLIS